MKEENEVKRNHFVPRTYQKNFSITKEGKDLYFINRMPKETTNEKDIKELSTKKICVENDIYTLEGDTKEERMFVEYFYGDNYEQHYSNIYKLLIDEQKETVTPEERKLIISTVVSMLFRTQKMPNLHNEVSDRVIEALYENCKIAGKNYFLYEGGKISIEGKTLEQMQKEQRKESTAGIAIIQLEVALKLIEIRMEKDGILVTKLLDDSEFITSDNPVTYHKFLEQSISGFDSDNILTLPLDNKHLLSLIPTGKDNDIVRFKKNGLLAKTCASDSNRKQLKSSNKYLLGTESGLKSFLLEPSNNP